NTLTRMTFVEPDGTEHELWDQLTGGQPQTYQPSPGFFRGQTFVAHDGSGMTFTADSPVYDPFSCNNVMGGASGNLRLRNGATYRFDGGQLTKITDRNGNWLNLAYPNYAFYPTITDNFNRTVTVSSQSPTTITYPGANGSLQSIIAYRD